MYPVIRNKHDVQILAQREFQNADGTRTEYLTFPLLDACDAVSHVFTTRIGGVSKGIYSSMNLSYSRGDDEKCVDENFARIAKIFGKESGSIVCSDQTHTNHVLRVTAKDAGKGVTIPRDYTDIDGLITNEEELILACFYADCVPVYFVDPVKRAIGLVHSGWRGTQGKISHQVISAMEREFGTNKKDILACIGPSICRECYEVSKDVASVFMDEMLYGSDVVTKTEKEGKYLLDLWGINKHLLLQAGILPEHIQVTDVCTCCNPDYLFSHRKSNGKRGNLGAFLMLRKS